MKEYSLFQNGIQFIGFQARWIQFWKLFSIWLFFYLSPFFWPEGLLKMVEAKESNYSREKADKYEGIASLAKWE